MILGDSKDYLRAKDVTNGDTITFKDEGAWVENARYKYPDGKPRQDFVITITHNDVEKSMRLNQTNRKALIQALSKDTAEWVGKTVNLNKIKAMVAGKVMDSILIEANDDIQADSDFAPDIPVE